MKVLLILNKYRSQLLTFMAIVGPTSFLGQNTEERKISTFSTFKTHIPNYHEEQSSFFHGRIIDFE